jgi:hypothetical protein
MKVLQVERIVPGLVVVCDVVLVFAALEFDWEDDGARNEDRVNAASKPGDIELEVDRAWQLT